MLGSYTVWSQWSSPMPETTSKTALWHKN